jgi:hypothetical protein
LAGKGPPLGHGVEFGPLHPATRTGDFGPAVVDFHELAKAGRVIRVFGLELLEGVLGHD